jgi:high-affinity iron transporter
MYENLVLVFREVLEAALIISIVAAATRGVPGRARWILAGIGLGIVGAAAVAAFAGAIGEAMDGMGQEWFNAGVLLAAVLMIGWHVVWMSRHARELTMQMKAVGQDVSHGRRPMTALLVVILLAVLREGSEVVLFGYGLVASGTGISQLLIGGALGLALGSAVGLAMYFGLLTIPVRHFFSATNWLLVLLAAGLASTAAGKLVQADVLPALADPLWDTSAVLSDQSALGEFLHILVGYTAQPAGMQMVFYAATVILLVVGMRLSRQPAPPAARPAPAQGSPA